MAPSLLVYRKTCSFNVNEIYYYYEGVGNVHIINIGFNYQTAPIDIREKLTFSDDEVNKAMTELNEQKSVLENVIVSTCNRTEVYAVVDQLHTGRHYVTQFLADWFDENKKDIVPYLQIVENDVAIEHLFRVTVGLDSMVLGETQILGQIRDAFLAAQKIKATGTLFNELFKQAITFAKRAHKHTSIGEHAVSVSYAAVELAKKIFGDLTDKHVVIIGAGEMAELALQNLRGAGVSQTTVVNRTFARATELAKRFGAQAVPYDALLTQLNKADILLSSTGSRTTILSKNDLEPIQKQRKGKPLFLVDIAVPRDFDPNLSELDNVFLYDIDDLQHIVDENLASRKKAAEKIEATLYDEVVAYKEWVTTLGVVPVMAALREKALTIQETTMNSIERKIPNLTEREKRVLNKHTKSIINQLLKQPITEAKEFGAQKHSIESLSLFVDIFGLDEEVKQEVKKQVEKSKPLMKLKKSTKNSSFPFIEKMMT